MTTQLAPGWRTAPDTSSPTGHTSVTFDVYCKLRYHADAAERAQARVEALERQAMADAPGQVEGRMISGNGAPPDTYIAGKLLDTHEYQRRVAIRNAHQAQVAMYAALLGAGIRETDNALGADGQIRLPKPPDPQPHIPIPRARGL